MAGLLGAAVPLAAAAHPIKRLWWRGRAHVEVGDRSLDLAVETDLAVPSLAVRSRSYIVADGPASARVLVIVGDGAWVERAGQRTALPAAVAAHERQQYALYGWLWRVQQGRRPSPGPLSLSAPPWPDATLTIGADGYPTAIEATVVSDIAGAPAITERMTLSGRIASGGVRWPRRFVLTQAGRPYFDLTIDAFRAD